MNATTKSRARPAPVLRPTTVHRIEPNAAVLADLKVMRRVAHAAKLSSARTPAPTVTNTSSTRHYAGNELKPYIGRPNAEQAQTLPSRVGSRLHYRDGLVTDLKGTVLSPFRSNA